MRLPWWAVVLMMAGASPASLAVETGLRRLLFPPDFELLRAYLRPALGAPAWGLCVATLLLGLPACWVQTRLYARLVAARGAAYADRARVLSLYAASTLPQLAALVAALAFTFGAPLTPVAVSVTAAALWVSLLGARAPSPAAGPRD